jgi:serine/threonine-protein kinase
MRAPFAVIVTLIALAVARSVTVLRALPPRMASHFDGSGQPNGFMSQGDFFVFYALVGGGAVALVLGIPWLTRAVPPSLINIPNRGYWLTPERLPLVHRKLGAWAGWFAASLTAFLVAVLELVLRANLAREPIANGPLQVLLGLLLLGNGMSIVLLVRSFRLPDDSPDARAPRWR